MQWIRDYLPWLLSAVTIYMTVLADLLGRVVMLTMPMASGLTERLSHCIGKVTIGDGKAQMIAAVRRDVF